jgi:LCP family protein required for cell wall assembly
MMAVGLTTLVLVGGAVAYAVFTYASISSQLAPSPSELKRVEEALDDEPESAPAGAEEPEYTYILLLGNDRRSGQTRARTDTIILARLSKADGSILLLSIPRDTRTEVPGHGTTKINHAAAYGGVPLAIKTVKKFTGLPVHHYVQVDFNGFGRIIDLLGGVDMYIDRPVNYGQGIVVNAGMQHLNGVQALSVVRNRKAYASGDFARIRNQQALLSAMARKTAAPGSLDRLPQILAETAGNVETDLSISQLTGLVSKYREALQRDLPGYTVPGTPAMIDGLSYVVTDKAAASKLFDAIRRGETPAE